MELKIKKIPFFKLTVQNLSNFAFIAYFCIPMSRSLFQSLGFTWEMSLTLAILIAYIPVPLLILSSKKNLVIFFQFLILYVGVLLFLGITLAFHPEYSYWYTRETYGVVPYILRLDNGIYAFLFIRLVNNADDIIKDLKVTGYIMYIYLIIQLLNALSRGYWVIESSTGAFVKFSYSLDFGYNVLFYMLVFVYLAMKEKTLNYIFLSVLGAVMILVGGSRGAFLCLVIFIVGYIFIDFLDSRNNKKIGIIFLIIILTAFLYLFYEPILYLIASLLERFDLPSRFITKLIEGSISDGSGRDKIWEAAIRMIKENPWGYGAMGARPVISKYHIVGYPHQFFLEIFIEFGIVIGTLLIGILIFLVVKILLMKNIGEWKYIFLIFFSNFYELMLSYTYWHKYALWALLAVIVCILSSSKIRRKRRTAQKRLIKSNLSDLNSSLDMRK